MKYLNNNLNKRFQISTYLAIGLSLISIVFSFYKNLFVRWWLMLPITFVGGLFFYINIKNANKTEKNVCIFGLCSLLVLLIIRDIILSQEVASGIDYINALFDKVLNSH